MKFYDFLIQDYKIEQKDLESYCLGMDFSAFEYCEMSMQHLQYINTFNGVHVYHNFGTNSYHFATDMYSIEPVRIEDDNSVLFEITDLEQNIFKIWLDLDVSNPEEIRGDWNKYIFYTNNSLDMQIKEFQDDAENFHKCLDKAIEFYQK